MTSLKFLEKKVRITLKIMENTIRIGLKSLEIDHNNNNKNNKLMKYKSLQICFIFED